MSLFQVREWWGVRDEAGAEYTPGALAVGNADNDHSGLPKIVTGSLNGVLRMYLPAHNEYKIEHLLLEENLRRPILQIELGYFVPNQRVLALAILHPRSLGVYVVEAVGGNGMSASYFKLTQRYEHRLGVDGEHFTAYNMICGPFGVSSAGATRDREHLCVQSLDGRLQFFEQDRLAFIQPLNQSFIPGALCYAPGMDAVVAETSDLQLECYRYQVLAQASMKKARSNKLGEQDDDEAARNKPVPVHSDWKLNLGEQIVDIRIGRCYYQENATSFDIIVLGEFTLFGIKPHGEIFLQKRLGFHPSAMCVFPRPPGADRSGTASAGDGAVALDNLLVASHSKLWSVYKDKALVWSACPSAVPVAMHVAEFGGINGMIVSLDSSGVLSVNYMGTDPPSTAVVASDTKELNYEEMDEEHRQLLNVIRRSQGERRTEPKDRLLLRAQVPSILDPPQSDSRGQRDEFQRGFGSSSPTNSSSSMARGTQLTMRVYVTYTGSSRLSNVTLSIMTPPNIIASESSIVIEGIDGRGSATPLIIPIVLRPSSRVMPTSLNVTVSAAYTLESGQPRVSQCVVRLPMSIMCRLVPPVKSSTFKFTLETNQEPLELSNLFEDMFHQPFCTPDWSKQVVGNSGGGGTNVLSFQYYNGIEATILVSKNAGRYRIQANELEALWMVSNELVQRLKAHFDSQRQQQEEASAEAKHSGDNPNDGEGFQVFYQEPLPLADFFANIDAHFALRREKVDLAAEMNDRAHQFRVIQKRLLVRYKDRNPAPINCLDALLHGTYEQLIALSQRMEDVSAKLSLAANRLSCCVHLVLMLIAFRFHLSDEDSQLLASYLSPSVTEDGGNGSGDGVGGGDQGWEERTDAAMTELLRTVLAKQQPNQQQSKEGASSLAAELQLSDDTKKLKKHITIVCDRLAKGATLVPGPPSEAKGGK